MNHLSTADWLVIAVYLMGVVALGSWFGRGLRDTRDYFLGSRTVAWWGIGMSIVATETSALTIIAVPAMAYADNLTFLQMVFGYVLARIVLAIFMVPHYFRGEIYSPYQLFDRAFGRGARQAAGGFFLLSETLAAGVRVYVACIPLQLLLGIEVLPAILLFIVVSLIYTYIGGVKAVIWTDAVQFVLFVAGGLYVIFYIPTMIDGGWSGALGQAATAGKLHWLNTGFGLNQPFNLWMGLVGGTVLGLSSHGAEQLIVQRVLTCGTVADGRRALTFSAVVILPLFFLFLLAGVMLWVFYQAHPFQIALPEVTPGSGIQANDFVLPIFILTEVPPLLRGLLIVAILSAAMSSVSSALSALASVSTMDFLKPLLRRERSEAAWLRIGKGSTLLWAGALILVAYLSREVTFVLNVAFSLRGLTSGALLGGLLLAVFGRRGGSTPVVAGMLTALGTMTAIHLLPRLDWTRELWMSWVGREIFWPWYTLIGTVVCLLVASTWTAMKARLSHANPGSPGNTSPHEPGVP
jgi:solute:Na+ symporter, SSS family